MSDNEKPADNPAEGQTPAPEGPDHREKMQYERDERARGRIAELEAERDTLRERNTRLVEAEVHRLMGEQISDVTAALKLSDKAVGDFLDPESGEVDCAKISDFAGDFVTTYPNFDAGKKPMGVAVGEVQTRVGAHQVVNAGHRTGWSDLLAGPAGTSGE